jgi:hypothetical protein
MHKIFHDTMITAPPFWIFFREREVEKKIHYRERLEGYKGNEIVTICVKNNSDAY